MSPARVLTSRVQRSVRMTRQAYVALHGRVTDLSSEAEEGRELAERLGLHQDPSELLADFKRQTEGAPVVRRVARPVG